MVLGAIHHCGAVIDLNQQKHTDWERVLNALAKRPGVTMFLGASDTGKTTCLRAVTAHLARAGVLPLAIVDADVGQSTIGPPTTVGLTLVRKEKETALLSGKHVCHAMCFVGALSPVGHLLQTIVATKRMVEKALRRGARAVLVDTTGLINRNVGFQLKLNKLELLEPRHIVALQRDDELEGLLSVLADRPWLTVHRLTVSHQARARSAAERYRYRTSQFAAYFGNATRVRLKARKLWILSPPTGISKITMESLPPVIPLDFIPAKNVVGCLVGLNNVANQTLALGLIERVTRHAQKMEILTPFRNCDRVRIVQLSNIRLAKTGEELGRLEAPGGQLLEGIARAHRAEISRQVGRNARHRCHMERLGCGESHCQHVKEHRHDTW